MRPDIPWNVAGIPSEAREAARAAARREGLSVGEWLTRRILRGFSDFAEEQAAMPYDRSLERVAPNPDRDERMDEVVLDQARFDAWGLPSSGRDTAEVL